MFFIWASWGNKLPQHRSMVVLITQTADLVSNRTTAAHGRDTWGSRAQRNQGKRPTVISTQEEGAKLTWICR